MVWYGMVWSSMVWCGEVWWFVVWSVRCLEMWWGVLRCVEVWLGEAVRCGAIRCDSVRCDEMRCDGAGIPMGGIPMAEADQLILLLRRIILHQDHRVTRQAASGLRNRLQARLRNLRRGGHAGASGGVGLGAQAQGHWFDSQQPGLIQLKLNFRHGEVQVEGRKDALTSAGRIIRTGSVGNQCTY